MILCVDARASEAVLARVHNFCLCLFFSLVVSPLYFFMVLLSLCVFAWTTEKCSSRICKRKGWKPRKPFFLVFCLSLFSILFFQKSFCSSLLLIHFFSSHTTFSSFPILQMFSLRDGKSVMTYKTEEAEKFKRSDELEWEDDDFIMEGVTSVWTDHRESNDYYGTDA